MFGIETRLVFQNFFNFKTYRNLIISTVITMISSISYPHILSRISRNTKFGIQLLKVNNGNTRTICEICSKVTIKALGKLPFGKFSKTEIAEKFGKVACLAIQKAFKNTQVFQQNSVAVPDSKQFVTETTKTLLKFKISYG